MTHNSFHDVEQLSVLLDEKLSPAEVARLQKRIDSDADLRQTYTELRQARTLLRRLPQRRAPRNFSLNPVAARVRPPLPRLFPAFRLVSVLASLLFFFSFTGNLVLPAFHPQSAFTSMADGKGGGFDTERVMTAEESVPQTMAEPALAESVPSMPEPTLEIVAPAPALQPEPALAIPEPSPAAVAGLPTWALFSLAGLALFSGMVAFLLRRQTDQNWKHQHSSKKGG
jgi:hypothetical protein